jgi:hypothetical protein
MVKMARYARHLFAKPLGNGVINHKGFFGGRFKGMEGLGRSLPMKVSPIQIFSVDRVIEDIFAHETLQAFSSKHANGVFPNPIQRINP